MSSPRKARSLQLMHDTIAAYQRAADHLEGIAFRAMSGNEVDDAVLHEAIELKEMALSMEEAVAQAVAEQPDDEALLTTLAEVRKFLAQVNAIVERLETRWWQVQ